MASANASSHAPRHPHPPLFEFCLNFVLFLMLVSFYSLSLWMASANVSSHNPRQPSQPLFYSFALVFGFLFLSFTFYSFFSLKSFNVLQRSLKHFDLAPSY